MRKLLLLITVLLTGVSGALAEPNAPESYVSSIETGVNYYWCLCDAASGKARYIHADGTKTGSYAHLTGAGIFQFEDAGDGYYYIKEVISGNYMYTDHANDVTIDNNASGKPYQYQSANALSAGTKQDADKFKWLVSSGSTTGGFFISSKVNANAVLAATSQASSDVYFYQYTETSGGNSKYPFANSKFLKVATSLSALSNSKCYNIYNNRAWWAVGSGATVVNSTHSNGLNLAVSTTDVNQQFAILFYDDAYDNDNDAYYLYSVGEGKFAYVDGTKLSLSSLGTFTPSVLSKVTYNSSTSSTYKNSQPTVIQIGGYSFGVHPTGSHVAANGSTLYAYSPWLNDDGNASSVIEAGSFTATTAMAALESYFYPTMDSGDTYTFNLVNKSDGTTPYYLSSPSTSTSAVKFVVTENGKNTEGRQLYSLKNSSTGEFLSYTNSTKSTGENDSRLSWEANNTNSKFLFSNVGNGKVAIRPAAASNENYLTAWKNNGTNKMVFWTDGTTAISYWTLNKITATVTYNLKWGDDVLATVENITIPVGRAASSFVPWTTPDYCNFTYDVETIEEETTTVNVTLNWNGPFDFSSDFASAKWYYMTLREKYAQNDGKNPYELSSTKVLGAKAHWAFMGNPYAVKVINELAGDGKYLDDGTNPQMGTTGTEWIITESSTSGAFQLHFGANKYFNDSGGNGKLGLWNNASAVNEVGSLLRVEAVPDNLMSEVTANIMPYVNNPGDGYFMLSETDAAVIFEKFTSYYGDSKISELEYDDMLTYLTNHINYPNSGYYVITNDNSSGMYMGFPNNGADRTHLKKYEDLGINTIARLDKQTDNTYFISFQGKYLYCYGNDQYIDGFTDYKTKVSGSVESSSVVLKSNGCYICVDGTGLYGKNTTDVSARWTIVDAAGTELSISLNTVGSKSYATFSAPFPVTIGDDAKAYIIETLDLGNNRAIYSEIASKQIPAGAGILLISETAASSVTATVSGTNFDALSGNILVGYNLASSFSYPTNEDNTWNLVLGNSATTGIGFYKMNGTASPNKAYLPYPYTVGSLAKGFSLISADDLETGIEDIKAKQQNEAVYDLSGRRVINPKRGLYITKGQKFVR